MAAHRLSPLAASLVLLLLAALEPVRALGFEVLDAEETAAMLALRGALYRSAAPWVAPIPGWSAHNPSPHCRWSGVTCEQRALPGGLPTRRVTQIRLWYPERLTAQQRAAAKNRTVYKDGTLAAAVPLLPELASKLPFLEHLAIGQFYAPFAGLPPEWLAPGAFPRVKTLELAGLGLGSGLPDLQPGRLPALEQLHLEFDQGGPAVLPPSWGSSPEVLPSLQALHVAMPLSPQLPGDWAHGFWQLRQLHLLSPACGQRLAAAPEAPPGTGPPHIGGATATAGRAAQAPSEAASKLGSRRASSDGAPAGGPPSASLPVAWAAGFPALRELTLCGLGLDGALPDAWLQHGAFPLLSSLNLAGNRLAGALPDQLFAVHKLLVGADLCANGFTGALPDAWAASKVKTLRLGNNSLSGPAFPPAWLAEEAMAALTELSLSGNRGLGGELPPELPWPSINTLQLAGTGVTGVIPQGWCLGPLKASLRHMSIRGTTIVPALPECVSRGAERLYLDVPAHVANGTADGGTAGSATSAALPEDAPFSGGVAPGSLPPGVLARTRQGQTGGAGTGFAVLVGLAAALGASAVLAAGVLGRTLWLRHQHRLRTKHGLLGGGGKGDGGGGSDEEQAQHLLFVPPAERPSSSARQTTAAPAAQPPREHGEHEGVAALLAATVQNAHCADSSPSSDTSHGAAPAAGSSGGADGVIELALWGAVPRDVTCSRESLLRRQQEEQQRQQLEASLLRQWQQMQEAQAKRQQELAQQGQQGQQGQQQERDIEANEIEAGQQWSAEPAGQLVGLQEQLQPGAAELQRSQQARLEASQQQQQHGGQLTEAPKPQQPGQDQARSQPVTPQPSQNAAQLQAQHTEQSSWQGQRRAQQAPGPEAPQQQQQAVMQALQAQLLRALQQPQRLPAEHQLLLQAIQQKLLLLSQQSQHLPPAAQQQLVTVQQQLLALARRQRQRQLAQPAAQAQPASSAEAPAMPAVSAAKRAQPAGPLSGGPSSLVTGEQHSSSALGSLGSSMLNTPADLQRHLGGTDAWSASAGAASTAAGAPGWPANPFAAAAAARSAEAEEKSEGSLIDDGEHGGEASSEELDSLLDDTAWGGDEDDDGEYDYEEGEKEEEGEEWSSEAEAAGQAAPAAAVADALAGASTAHAGAASAGSAQASADR